MYLSIKGIDFFKLCCGVYVSVSVDWKCHLKVPVLEYRLDYQPLFREMSPLSPTPRVILRTLVSGRVLFIRVFSPDEPYRLIVRRYVQKCTCTATKMASLTNFANSLTNKGTLRGVAKMANSSKSPATSAKWRIRRIWRIWRKWRIRVKMAGDLERGIKVYPRQNVFSKS